MRTTNEKYLIIFKISDHDLASSWHSGSSVYEYAEYGYSNFNDASVFANRVKNALCSIPSDNGNVSKYGVNSLVLSYAEDRERDVEEFYKYRTYSKSSFARKVEEIITNEEENEKYESCNV